MSYDMRAILNCSHCGQSTHFSLLDGITHNLNPIVELCLSEVSTIEGLNPNDAYRNRSWGRFQGHRVGDVREIFIRAYDVLIDPANHARLVSHEPVNRWGTHGDLCAEWGEMLNRLREVPDDAVLEVRG